MSLRTSVRAAVCAGARPVFGAGAGVVAGTRVAGAGAGGVRACVVAPTATGVRAHAMAWTATGVRACVVAGARACVVARRAPGIGACVAVCAVHFNLAPSAVPHTPAARSDTAPERRRSPLLAAADRRQDAPSRPVAPGRRGFPGPASTAPEVPVTPHCTPVPTPAHSTPRAVRVRRSPR